VFYFLLTSCHPTSNEEVVHDHFPTRV
jgi:hypothetical protein